MLSMLLLGVSLFQWCEKCAGAGETEGGAIFSHHRPLPQIARVLFSLGCFIFTTSHFLRAWPSG